MLSPFSAYEKESNLSTMCLVLPGIWKRDFVKTKHLPLASAVSLASVDFIHILKAFYHLHISLVLNYHRL